MNIGLRKWVLDHNAVGLLKNAQVFILFFQIWNILEYGNTKLLN